MSSGSAWWVVGVAGVAILAGVRWALADFLLDQFGAPPDAVTQAAHAKGEPLASDRSESQQSSSRPEAVQQALVQVATERGIVLVDERESALPV